MHGAALRAPPLPALQCCPTRPYSDMNGYGHFVRPFEWFSLYWTIFAAILLIVGHLFWVRGTETAMRIRTRVAGGRLGNAGRRRRWRCSCSHSPPPAATSSTTRTSSITTRPTTSATNAPPRRRSCTKSTTASPQPRITDVQADVDIYPDKRWVDIRGTYTLVNKTQQPISDLHVVMIPDVTMSVHDSRRDAGEERRRARLHDLSPRAAARARRDDADVVHGRRFTTRDSRTRAATTRSSRTAPSSTTSPPSRTSATARTSSCRTRNKRRKYGLAPVVRAAKIDDPKARMDNGITRDADWINLDTTVSTVARPDRPRARLSAEGVDRQRPPLLPLQDHVADPRISGRTCRRATR